MDGFTGSTGDKGTPPPGWAHGLGLLAAAVAAAAFAVVAWSSLDDLGALLDEPPAPATDPWDSSAAAVAPPAAVPSAEPSSSAAPAPPSEPALPAAALSAAALPELLSQTGLYAAAAGGALHAEVLAFSPQYPLWSDGATKRRFLRLPPGTTIDGSDPDAWVFPVGTRFWKEFSFGRRVETRYIERRADGSWTFASYVWDDAERDARLAPESGVRGVAALPSARSKGALPQAGSRPQTLRHDIPSRDDCLACHEGGGARAPILGFNALQLSSARDPLAPHAEALPQGALDTRELLARGLLRGYPEALTAVRVEARTPTERAALGYLSGNCSGCHNAHGPLADLGLDFEQTAASPGSARVLSSVVSQVGRFRLPGEDHSLRVAPGDPAESILVARLSSRQLAQQMPPLGSKVVDQEATALVAAWIEQLKSPAPIGAN